MSRPSLADLFDQLLVWVDRTERVVASRTFDDMLRDEVLQLALTRCIEGVGEASRRIMEKYPDAALGHPDLPLAEAYHMRNRLAHWYETVNFEIVWNTACFAVPTLGQKVRRARAELDADQP